MAAMCEPKNHSERLPNLSKKSGLQDLEEQIEVLTKLKSFLLRDNREGGYL